MKQKPFGKGNKVGRLSKIMDNEVIEAIQVVQDSPAVTSKPIEKPKQAIHNLNETWCYQTHTRVSRELCRECLKSMNMMFMRHVLLES
jgi:hypothetical protein